MCLPLPLQAREHALIQSPSQTPFCPFLQRQQFPPIPGRPPSLCRTIAFLAAPYTEQTHPPPASHRATCWSSAFNREAALKIFLSPSGNNGVGAFYNSAHNHAVMPDDIIEISPEKHA